MKEKINLIYKSKSKSFYYNQVLDQFNNNDVNYILLNFKFPENDPGDIDVMINLKEKNIRIDFNQFWFQTLKRI